MKVQAKVYRNRKEPVLDRTKVLDEIKDNKGKFFSCEFTKADGSLRKLHGRTGVKKHLRGGVNKVQKPSNSLVTAWDRRAEDYRTINIKTLSKITLRGKTYKVV